MTLEEYKHKLKVHDWGYHYSDDHQVFLRGSNNQQELLNIALQKAKDGDSSFYDAYKEESSKRVK